jgi:heterodisulfide reductase subunit C
MWQSVIVTLILCAAFAVVIRRLWRTTSNVSQGGCGCSGCGQCPGSVPGGAQTELKTFQLMQTAQSETTSAIEKDERCPFDNKGVKE